MSTGPQVDRHIDVTVPPAVAFATWTQRVGLWWPPGHRLAGEADAVLQLQPQVGGRFFERTRSGRELDYGRVVAWEPPERLQLAFFLGGGPDHPSLVDVFFRPIDGGTRVEIHHQPGQLGAAKFSDLMARYVASWTGVLDAFSAATTSAATISSEGD